MRPTSTHTNVAEIDSFVDPVLEHSLSRNYLKGFDLGADPPVSGPVRMKPNRLSGEDTAMEKFHKLSLTIAAAILFFAMVQAAIAAYRLWAGM